MSTPIPPEGGPAREDGPVSQATRRFNPEPWRQELLAFAHKMGAGQDAEDVVQEAFARAVARPPRHQPRAWLYRVALNLVRDRGRARQRDASALPRLAPRSDRSPAPGPAHLAETRDLAAHVWHLVQGLSGRKRAALYLRIQRHMDFDEIATVLDCSVASARQHFFLAVKAMRDALAEEGS